MDKDKVWRNQIEDLKNELKTKKEKNIQLELKIVEQNKKHKRELSDLHRKHKTELSDLHRKHKTELRDVTHKESNYNSHSGEINKHMLEEIGRLKHNNQDIHSQLKTTHTTLQQKTEASEILIADLSSLRGKMKDLERELKDAKTTSRRAQLEYKTEKECLDTTINQLKSKNDTLSRENDQIKSRESILLYNVRDKKRQIQTYEQTCHDLKEKLHRTRKELEEEKRKGINRSETQTIITHIDKVAIMENEHTKLTNENDELKREKAHVLQLLDQLKIEHENIKRSQERIELQLADQNGYIENNQKEQLQTIPRSQHSNRGKMDDDRSEKISQSGLRNVTECDFCKKRTIHSREAISNVGERKHNDVQHTVEGNNDTENKQETNDQLTNKIRELENEMKMTVSENIMLCKEHKRNEKIIVGLQRLCDSYVLLNDTHTSDIEQLKNEQQKEEIQNVKRKTGQHKKEAVQHGSSELNKIHEREDGHLKNHCTTGPEIQELKWTNADLQINVKECSTNQTHTHVYTEKHSLDFYKLKQMEEKLGDEVINVRAELEKTRKEMDHLQGQYNGCKDREKDYERKAEYLTKYLDQLKQQNNTLKKDVCQLQTQLEHTQNENVELQNFKDEFSQHQREFNTLRSENRKIKHDVEMLQKENDELKTANKLCEATVKENMETIKQKQLENDSLMTEKQTQLSETDHLKQILHQKEADYKRLKNLKVKDEEDREKEEVKRKEDVHSKLETYTNDTCTTSNKVELSNLKMQLAQANTNLREARLELDDTKTRLSKFMGQKLTDNNPNIADLSDKNRPTKLAERFTELYDNQWTDAFEVIDNENEQETIGVLILILNATMQFCQTESDGQMEKLRAAVTLSDISGVEKIPDLLNKQLKDCRKAAVEQSGKQLYQKYLAYLRISESQIARMALQVHAFQKECFEVCWLMSIQDPPVVLGPELKHGHPFNTDIYKAYTRSGPTVDYIVWPALYLYQGGAILCKGVAQGFGERKKKHN